MNNFINKQPNCWSEEKTFGKRLLRYGLKNVC